MAKAAYLDTIRNMQSSRRKRTLTVVAITVALALIAGIYYYRSNNIEDFSPIKGEGSTEPAETLNPDGSPVVSGSGPSATIYLDGWSYATIAGKQVTYAPDTQGGASLDINWSPLNEDDIKALAKDNPDVVERMAARLFSTASDLACTDAGCTSSEGDLSLAELASPPTIPGLGDVYKDYKVNTGIWSAQLSLPSDASSVILSAPDWTPMTLSVINQDGVADIPADSQIDVQEGEEAGSYVQTMEPAADNGYLKSVYPVSAALGSFFITTPTWIEDEARTQDRRHALGTDLSVESIQEKLSEPLFAKGLATPDVLANGLNASQLTYMSSPTTGCGIGVLCAPTTIETTFTDFDVSITPVCKTDDGQKAFISIENAFWNFTLPGATSMRGAWDGQSEDDFKGPGVSAVYTGQAPLISGDQRLKETVVRLYDGTNGEVKLFGMAGQMAQDGFDSDESLNRVVTAEDIPNLFDGQYAAC